MPIRATIPLAVLLVALCIPAAAQTPAAKPIPSDGCILDMILPADALVTVDGVDYGKKRSLTYRPLKAGAITPSKVVVQFADGTKQQRDVWLEPGRHLKFSMLAPDANRPELVLQTGHEGGAVHAAFTQDDRYIVTAAGPQVLIWEVATGQQIRSYPVGPSAESIVMELGLSADGKRVVAVAGISNSRLLIWDRETGASVKPPEIELDKAKCLSPDGAHLAVARFSNEIDLHSLSTGKKLRTFGGFEGSDPIADHSLQFSADGAKLVAGAGKTALLWDVKTAKQLHKLPDHRYDIQQVAFSRDGKRVMTIATKWTEAMSHPDNTIYFWDADSGAKVAEANVLGQRIDTCALSDDGKVVYLSLTTFEKNGGVTTKLQSFDTAELKPLQTFSKRRTIDGGAVQLNRDGSRIYDGTQIFDTTTGNKIQELTPRISGVVSLDITGARGLQVLAALGMAGQGLAVADWSRGGCVQLLQLPAATPYCIETQFVNGGRRIAAMLVEKVDDVSVVGDNDLVLLDPQTGAVQQRTAITKEGFAKFSATPSGRYAVVKITKELLGPYSISVWDLAAGRKIRQAPEDEQGGMAISPDGQRYATAPFRFIQSYEWANLWDVASGRRLKKFTITDQTNLGDPRVTSHTVEAITFSPTTKTVATSGTGTVAGSQEREGMIVFWDPDTGAPRGYHSTTDTVDRIGYNDNGNFLWGGCRDNTASIWPVWTRVPPRKVDHFSHSARPTITPDGRQALTVSSEGSILLWDLATGSQLGQFIFLNGGKDWLVATPEGLFDGTTAARDQLMFRVGGGLNLVPVDRFFQDFYRPGLLAELLGGERPQPEVQLAKDLPPTVTITSPQAGRAISQTVTVAVEAVDRGSGIANVSIYQNGARVLADGQTRQEGKKVYRTFDLTLVEGENQIRVTAANGDGSWESEPAEITLRYDRPLSKSRLHLVAVGINKYADANLNLGYAAPDATAIAELFRRRGGVLYEQVKVTELTDDQATKAGIKAALKKAAEETRPQDTFVLFMAGHGAMVGQRYYFVPHELRRQTDKLQDDLRAQGIPADELSEHLGSAKALKRIMILDTCASGGALGLPTRGRSGFALRGVIERLSRSQGVFTIAASAASEEAQESKQLGHGVLTYTLLAALKGINVGPLEGKYVQPNSRERVVDVLEWFSYASGNVPRLTEKLFGQSQDVQTSTIGSSFPVLPLED
jgi:WD40 repeat protein